MTKQEPRSRSRTWRIRPTTRRRRNYLRPTTPEPRSRQPVGNSPRIEQTAHKASFRPTQPKPALHANTPIQPIQRTPANPDPGKTSRTSLSSWFSAWWSYSENRRPGCGEQRRLPTSTRNITQSRKKSRSRKW